MNAMPALAAGAWATFFLYAVLSLGAVYARRTRRLAAQGLPAARDGKPPLPTLSVALGRRLRSYLPVAWATALQQRLGAVSLEHFLGQWALLLGAGCLLAGAAMLISGLPLWLPAGVMAAVVLIPPWRLGALAAERRRQMRAAFPFLLDFLSMCLAAGVSLEAGLYKAGQRLRGPLGEALQLYVHNAGRGMTRREALSAFAATVGLPEVHLLVQVLIQSESFGLPLVEVLRAQAEQFRTDRRLRAEEAAQKLPLKLLFPLVLFIFPALFLLLLGPAVLWIMQNLVVPD